jgi:hypothetical protein
MKKRSGPTRRLKTEDRRTNYAAVYLSPKERLLVEQAAAQHDLCFTSWMRNVVVAEAQRLLAGKVDVHG